MPHVTEFVGLPPNVPPRRYTTLTVVAQDPSVRDRSRRVVTAGVRVPADHFEPGPRSHRFHVVDYDASTSPLHPPAIIGAEDAFADTAPGRLLDDFSFHAQNVYAIAARTLATFEAALGRRLAWGFPSHQLFLVPHAFAEANAYYASEDQALYFGYFAGEGGRRVYTCLSHDVIAHETTHAILDGLRPSFVEPGLPDQAAFHEAFADIVALLSVFSLREVVENLLGDTDSVGRIPASHVTEKALKESALFKLAEEMGQAASGERGSALRRSVELDPSDAWRDDPAYDEPHRRGEVLVAAIMQTLSKMWRERLEPLVHARRVDRGRAAEEGARAAGHLLRMVIRAIDYSPPVEFEFEDFVDAIVVSDSVVAPDDDHGYRGLLQSAFAAFGISTPEPRIVDLTTAERPPTYDGVNFTSFRSDRDEIFRFLWGNADMLGIDRRYHVRVENVRPSVRVGPDGLIVNETTADYIQMLDTTAGEAAGMGVALPDMLSPSTPLGLLGGGTLIFDQFGHLKYHQTKPLLDVDRQTRRLAYLVRNGLRDTKKRFGFSSGTPRGQTFAEFHAPDDRAGERW